MVSALNIVYCIVLLGFEKSVCAVGVEQWKGGSYQREVTVSVVETREGAETEKTKTKTKEGEVWGWRREKRGKQ